MDDESGRKFLHFFFTNKDKKNKKMKEKGRRKKNAFARHRDARCDAHEYLSSIPFAMAVPVLSTSI